MGCSISCSLFEKFSSFLEFQVKRLGQSQLITNYLDDFLFIGSSAARCEKLLSCFQSIYTELGVPLANERTFGPAQTISFMGLEINAATQTVCVPADKVLATSALIQRLLSKKKISLNGIQSLH